PRSTSSRWSRYIAAWSGVSLAQKPGRDQILRQRVAGWSVASAGGNDPHPYPPPEYRLTLPTSRATPILKALLRSCEFPHNRKTGVFEVLCGLRKDVGNAKRSTGGGGE